MSIIKKIITECRYRLFCFKNRKRCIILSKSAYLAIPHLKLLGICYLGPNGSYDAKGGITVGNNVIIGPSVTILTSSHNYKTDSFLPYGGDDILSPVTIGDNVWIGSNVLILPGVTIGEGAVIGAGAVVTKNVRPGCIVAGNPAKEIGMRDMDVYNKLKTKRLFYLTAKYNLNSQQY